MSDLNFEVRTLDGNLCSSGEISAFSRKYQEYLNKENWSTGELVHSSLQWEWAQPKIQLFHDDSNNQKSFLHEAAKVISDLANQSKEVMVSPCLHYSLGGSLEVVCKHMSNVSFGYPDAILGCQFQCVIIVLDVFTCFPPLKYLVDFMTRATTSLHFLVNTSTELTRIGGHPANQFQVCLTREVESKLRKLIH